MQKRLFFLVAMLLTLSLTALAQITTSSMAGKVTIEGTGEEVIGATVQAIHEPSGTRYNAVTNATGRFAIQGMRTGGPYAVTVTYIGFQPKTLKSIWVKPTTCRSGCRKTPPSWLRLSLAEKPRNSRQRRQVHLPTSTVSRF